MSGKIYQNGPGYSLFKSYIMLCFRIFYNKIIIRGTERIPLNQALIIAPNHLNALMDALALVLLPPHNRSRIFLARSDIFKSKFNAAFLRFIKIIPAYRIRDGYENLTRNEESFDISTDVLKNFGNICIMPEGNQGTERNIRPLAKGIFRIAFRAQEKFDSGESVYILPVGLDMGDFIKIRKHLILNVGNPIRLADFQQEYNENPALAINHVRAKLRSSLEEQTLHIPSGEDYHLLEFAVYLLDERVTGYRNLKSDAFNHFQSRQKIAQALNDLKTQDPGNYSLFLSEINSLFTLKEKVDIDMEFLKNITENKKENKFKLYFLAIFGLPILIPGLILNIVPGTIPIFIRKWMKIEFIGFWSSFHFALGILSFPIIYTLQAILLLNLFNLPTLNFFWLIMLQALLALPTYYFLDNLIKLFRLHSIKHKKATHILRTALFKEKADRIFELIRHYLQ